MTKKEMTNYVKNNTKDKILLEINNIKNMGATDFDSTIHDNTTRNEMQSII